MYTQYFILGVYSQNLGDGFDPKISTFLHIHHTSQWFLHIFLLFLYEALIKLFDTFWSEN